MDVDMQMDPLVDLQEQDALMHHIVLPRVLPQAKSSNLYQTEMDLMNKMVENVEKCESWIPTKTVEMFLRLRKVHNECTSEAVSAEIKNLNPGDTFAMFVRMQHCAIMIHVPSTEQVNDVQNVIVATIPGSLHPKEVYRYENDIAFKYPQLAINVKSSQMLMSQEFAHQMCVLYHGLPVEHQTRDCVSKWLLTLLMDDESTATTEEEFPVITKKMRDENLGQSKTNFFRRSSFYMSVKVMLQHSLTQQLAAVAAKTLYKIVMLKFMVETCAPYKQHDRFDIDLLSQMIAKLARRIEKLSTVIIEDNINDLYDNVIKEAKETIAIIRAKIDKQIKEIQDTSERNAELPPLTDLNFLSDISYKMPKLEKYLIEKGKNVHQTDNSSKRDAATYRRYSTSQPSQLPDVDEVKKADELGQRIFWMEFERMVLYEMEIENVVWEFENFRTWSFAYAEYAEKKYTNNQLFISRMLLVRLKMIAMMDKLATNKHSLLLEHRTGVDYSIIDCLLLPQHTDMRIALKIEDYFRCRNDERAIHPSLIEEQTVSECSFTVKYARKNQAMKKLREKILAKDEENVARKKKEWLEGRKRVEKLKSEANLMKCNKGRGRWCEHCSKSMQANGVRIYPYEHLLPEVATKQFAIVFELKIPIAIASLRDCMWAFAQFCHGQSKKLKIEFDKWSEYNDSKGCLESYSESDSESKLVELGSTAISVEYHCSVNLAFEEIIYENSFDCTFHDRNGMSISSCSTDNPQIKLIKAACTFKAKDEYLGLQWTMDSTQHSENQVLSSQSKCPTDLTLSEYKFFGSLRSDGHRLQIRKLYAMIETEALSFEKESVLALVMQTLWECGVSGDGNFIRESHIDFGDVKFCSAMIELLQKYVEQQKNNWMHPFKLLTATLIAVRAFEINGAVALADKIASFLCLVRNIALDWIGKIEDSIRSMPNPNESTERNLRLKLIYVAIIGGLTFYVHPSHKYYQKIFKNNTEGTESVTAVRSWLRFIISLKNHILMYTSDEKELPSTLIMFLRLIESVGVSSERKIIELVTAVNSGIISLIRNQWSSAEYATFKDIRFHSEYPQIFVAVATIDSTDKTITIDIITGSFLVDGLPLSRLPSNIIKSNIYRWFFGNVVFEVQPDAQRSFSTVHKYNECSYEFKMIKGNVIVTEKKGNVEKELIDQKVFVNDFPYHLVNDYSHWWNKGENSIEFRQRAFGAKHFSKENTVAYRFDLTTRHLIHVQTERKMLDIRSESYIKITKQLSRLEHPKYIHVLLNDAQEAKVELLRMNLKFTVEVDKTTGHSELISNELNGMRVNRKQNIGTLYGLNHGLALESVGGGRKILLIPNGCIDIDMKDARASVSIAIENDLLNPPFYQYRLDEFCCQLKSSNGSYASWFYLAYLHAITSHGEIEPFTGMSGTERSIQILQSAFAWSSTPYEPEAVKMLEKIAKLTPLRNLFENYMQIVTWPINIPKRSAQDCFVFIARKLLTDSQRLRGLHGESSEKNITLNTKYELNERDHRRCQRLNTNLCVSASFIKHKVLTTKSTRGPFALSKETRKVCILYHKQRCIVSADLNLKKFLTQEQGVAVNALQGIGNEDRVLDLLNHCVHEDFRNLWISLYVAAVNQKLNDEQFAVILSFYAHRGENIDAILALQAIARNSSAFQQINPPTCNKFEILAGTYRLKDVTNILKEHYKQPDQYYSNEWSVTSKKRDHDTLYDEVLQKITSKITGSWPCDSFDITVRWKKFEYIDFKRANASINEKLKIWYANHQLNVFIDSVKTKLESLNNHNLVTVPPIRIPLSVPRNWSQTSIDFDQKIRDNSRKFINEIEVARDIWKMNRTDTPHSSKYWWEIYKKICDSNETHHLIQAGIFPRVLPSLLLPKIMDTHFDDDLRCLIGAYAIAISREQREKRIQVNSQRPELRAALDREEENNPFENWSPSEYPEWLLFEIEQNLTIRRIQIEIAKRMIEPPENENGIKHSVMQLNMGEGKTAVIVPILAARLANGTQACQITVLKSLFATNLKSLRQYLGGLLNRRIYIFPCRRDLPIEQHASKILDNYKECKQEKGVILTLPEYQLSFQLKIYESIAVQLQKDDEKNYQTAKKLMEVLKWVNANVRTVLDESDAILHAKYQLIYTVGKQMKPDGDSQRWLVVQALLQRVPFHMQKLYTELGREKVEFEYAGKNNNNFRSDVFTRCRILAESVFEDLKGKLIEDFLEGRLDLNFPGIDETMKEKLRYVLQNKAIDRTALKPIEDFTAEQQNTIYILSGLLRFEVLKLALTKRWRVNYGVDVQGKRKMAIPFKAKDVAAELTEFGHPDVGVCFTQLSYYYSGLTDAQLYQVFKLLENLSDAAGIYDKWMESIPQELLVPSIVSYNGVNLDDAEQRDGQIFPLLRFNMNVIDFWLSHLVYPSELKIFEKKLMCTAWDLCSEHSTLRVTGFSGTNDTRNILPMSIAQNDLKELENTNKRMREILMDRKNEVYEKPGNVSGKEILKELVELEIRVLLDSGALMLELNNKQVAVEWLKLATHCNAAVYFDEHDTLQTIDRNNIVAELDYSVYREDLSKCVVYLDDAHTRGTDLKFPPDWRACVTLSGDITRDKTVQSCMRMRQLATTQRILFWASTEADIRLREISKQSKVKSTHVMQFIENNSQRFETANMVHWTTGALNYTKKMIGHTLYENQTDDRSLDKLYKACVDDDFVKLTVMYGEKEEALLSKITWHKFSKLAFECKDRKVRNFIEKMKNDVDDKLEKQAPEVKRFTHALDEEQEKELEQEIEEQTQVERPPDATPEVSKFDERLEQLVLNPADATFKLMKEKKALLSIVESLSNTPISEFVENNEDAWAKHLLVTKDYKTVVVSQSLACNDFLRPVWWIARIKNPEHPNAKDILILLSTFECNHLLPTFRQSTNATLYMYRPRLSRLHSNLIRETNLHVTGMTTTKAIDIEDEIQIGVYSGLQYFANEDEQNAYCGFLGIIPKPWSKDVQMAFDEGIIKRNGFVPCRKRNHSGEFVRLVGQCKFKEDSIDLVVKLIEAHHQRLAKDSHAASILKRCKKEFDGDDAMQE